MKCFELFVLSTVRCEWKSVDTSYLFFLATKRSEGLVAFKESFVNGLLEAQNLIITAGAVGALDIPCRLSDPTTDCAYVRIRLS